MTTKRVDVTEDLRAALRDRFSVHGLVGEGAMAFVYEATDLRHNRKVAIKVLKPEIASDLGTERFLREIRIVARLSHPHVMPLHESGEVNGVLYYVMPLVTGENLRDRMQRPPALTRDESLRIFRDVAQALTYAHHEGVIHRDLKPANIMLSGGIAVVTDFGIARAHEFAGSDQLTQVGLVVGTPAYMSPEQATGDAPVDARSDIYSLGCILYELLAGKPPYSGTSAMSVIAKHAADPIPDLQRTRPDIPTPLASAVARSLAKTPDERFATVEEFAAAVDATQTSHSAMKRRPGASRALRWSLLLGALSSVLVAGALFLRSRRAEAKPIPLLAVLPFEHIGLAAEKYFTDGITDEISSRIASVSGIAVVSRTSALQFTLGRNTLQDIASKLKADYVLVGTVRTDRKADGTQLVRVTPKLVDVKSGREIPFDELNAALVPGEIFDVQGKIARNVATALDVALSPEAIEAIASRPTTNLAAYNHYLRGIIHASQFLVRVEQLAAIDAFEKATQVDPQFALAFARLAQVQSLFYTVFDRTSGRMARWKGALDRAVALDSVQLQTRVALAQWHFYAKRDANRAMTEIDAIRRRQPNNTELLWLRARVLRSRGDFAGALESFDAVAALDPRSAIFPFEAATALYMLRRFDEALARMTQAAELAPDWLPPRTSKARALLLTGRQHDAQEWLKSLEPELPSILPQFISEPLYRDLWDSALPQSYQDALARVSFAGAKSDSGEYYQVKGALYRRRGNLKLQRAYFDSALTVLSGRRANGASGVFTLVDLGSAYIGTGRQTQARAYADSAAAAEPMKIDAFRGWFATIELARLYVRVGAPERALEILENLKTTGHVVPAAMLTGDPVFESMRTIPRMRALLTSP